MCFNIGILLYVSGHVMEILHFLHILDVFDIDILYISWHVMDICIFWMCFDIGIFCVFQGMKGLVCALVFAAIATRIAECK